MGTHEVLDAAVVRNLRQLTPPGEPDVLTAVLQLFLADVPTRVERLTDALNSGNAAAVQRAAHSLKGSSGNIGARAMYDVCRRIDEAANAGDLAGVKPLLEALATELAKVEAEIRRLLITA